MAWNEPGNNGKDPWNRKKKEQGPPDLDDIVQKVQDKVGGLFGGGGKKKNGGSGNDGDGAELGWGSIIFLFVIFLIIWSSFGFYTIQPAEMGVVTQFGKYDRTTLQGLNWHLPYPIEEVQKVNVEHVRAVNHRALMLTQDENIVVIALVVQYRVKETPEAAKDYLFNVKNPDDTLLQATESALREVVGTSKMNGVLTSERDRVAADTKKLIQDIVDRYKTGLKVISVNMQNAQPPEAVQGAFADVIKAREDEERSKNQAHAYANKIVERAKGFSDQLREESEAYKAKVIAAAVGETQRFLSILTEYEKAPEITRQRLYLESMESMLSNSSKVMVDVNGGNNLMVLPLEKLLGKTSGQEQTTDNNISGKPTHSSPMLIPSNDDNIRNNDPRSRGGR
jgi:membrane protease subunit HflK